MNGPVLPLILAALAVGLLALRAGEPVLRALGLAVAVLLAAVAVHQVWSVGGVGAWRGMQP